MLFKEMKTEVVWLQSYEEIVIKQEKDDPLESWTNTPGPSHQKQLECKTEITHDIVIKKEPQESIENEDLSSLDLEHVNPLRFLDDEIPIKKDCDEVNDVDSDKLKGFSVEGPDCKIKYLEKVNFNEQLEYDGKRHDSLDDFSKKCASSSVGNRQIGEKCFVCDICNKSFNTKQLLTRHARTHTGEKPFSCELCHKRFTDNSHLTSHRRIHTGEKPFPCDMCHKKFTQNSQLTRHRRTHTGEKPFSCDQCSKQFIDNAGLIIHRRTHTGEKPFSCDLCPRQFIDSTGLTRHKRTHAEFITQRSYCKTEYFEKNGLRHDSLDELSKESSAGHGNRENKKRFACNVCYKKFHRKQNMADHVRTHTGEKPFSCDMCHREFTHKSNLTRHRRVHTGEKPFSCELCHKSFTYKSNLIDHRKTHTSSPSHAICVVKDSK